MAPMVSGPYRRYGYHDGESGTPRDSSRLRAKTDVKTFTRIVREGYVPSFAEFTDGRVKTNDPNLLMQFKSAFRL